ncbi:MAG: MFS transporter [Candidatus Aenigmatarchaeota archaeon]
MSFLHNKAINILLFTNAIVMIAGAMLGPIYAIFVEEVGGDILDASITGSIFFLATGITSIFSGKYVDKIKDPELILVAGYLITSVGYIFYIFVNSVWSLLIVQVIIGFAEAIYWPAYDAIYSRHVSLKKVGKEWGFWEATSRFSIAIGSLIGGFIVYNFGFDTLFISMSLLSFSSAIYIYFLPRNIL